MLKKLLSPRWIKVIRDLFDNKARTVLSILSIAVGVSAFGGMLVAREAIRTNLNSAYFASNPSDITLTLGAFDRELLRWVKTQPGVADAAGSTSVNGVVTLASGVERDVTVQAFSDLGTENLNKKVSISGAYPPPNGTFLVERGSQGGGIGVGGLTGLREGDVLRITLTSDKVYNLTYAGVIYDVNAQAGPAATRSNIYVTERTLADLGIDARPTRLTIKTTPGTTVADKYLLAETLSDELGRRGVIVRGTNVNERGEHWAATTIDGILVLLVLVGAVAMVMSGFLIVNVINGLLLSQKKIIGIMKIVGGERVQVFGVYIVIMLSLGVLALLIAIPLSSVLGAAIAGFMGGFLNFDTRISGLTPTIIVLEIMAALLVPLLFSASPIWNALKITAAAAISEVTPRQKASVIERALAKLENLPRIVVLAVRSLFRNNLRLVATLITLVVAGTLFTSIMNLRQAIPATLTRNTGFNKADVTITFATSIQRTSAVARAMQVPGVTFAEGWTSTQATVVRESGDGSTVALNGGDAASRFVEPPIVEGGRWLAPYSAESRDEIVISQGLVDSEPSLKVGGTLTLKRGTTTRTFRIVGLMRGPGSQAFGHYDIVSRFGGGVGMVNSVRVATADPNPAFTAGVAQQLRASFENANISVVNSQNRAELLNTVINAFSVIVTLMIAVAALIAVVGGLGLAGTMSLSVMERTREVGVMRAVGAESPDLRLMFVLEGLSIGLLSALVAFVLSIPGSTLIGQLLGTAMRQGTFDTQYSLPGYALWLVIVCVVSVVASLSPANKATKISIREALAYT
jgi:putative ABC transport system permease protein